MKNKFIVECVWSRNGITCHRTYENWVGNLPKIDAIQFSDGTHMTVEVRNRKPYEKITEIHGYDELLGRAKTQEGLSGFVPVDAIKP